MHEMPLVIFTILSQMVIGGFVTLWWLDWKYKDISKQSGLTVSISLVVIGGVSVLVSLFHLGHPFEAYRAILNIGVSWLSREVTFYGVFVGLSVLYTWFWIKEAPGKRSLVGGFACIIGVIDIFSSAKIYMIPAIPAWNSVTTLFSFFLTSLILGPLFVGALLSIRGELSVNLSGIAIGSLVVSAIVMMINFSTLQSGLPQAVEVAQITTHQLLFWIRMFTFVIAFAILAFSFNNQHMRRDKIYTLVVAILFVSEFLARFQFYETAIHL
ncbi:MAG TPA: DmsC/YnfH family molybdoenzyme membrane anchor subunit [Neobacillus sp.]